MLGRSQLPRTIPSMLGLLAPGSVSAIPSVISPLWHSSPSHCTQIVDASLFIVKTKFLTVGGFDLFVVCSVWKYDGARDSVLQVTRDGYLSCNTTNPVEEYNGGNNTVKLERSGAHYFISGAKGHCEKGEKLIVVVLSQRHRKYTGISPAPSPAKIEAPAVAPSPTSGAESFRNGLRVTGLVAAGVTVLGILF